LQVDSIKTRVESAAWYQLLKLKYDKLLSSFAFEFNLRRYIKGESTASIAAAAAGAAPKPDQIILTFGQQMTKHFFKDMYEPPMIPSTETYPLPLLLN
jgi:hypothetical protein